MIRQVRSFLLILGIVSFLCPVISQAQIDDVGAWLSASVQKKITREMEASITGELRFNNDASAVDELLSDAGLEYSLSKKLKAGLHYRFISKNEPNYYSKRHRVYFDLSYKQKVSSIALTVRGRIQEQYTDFYSSETGKIPDWVFRGKLSAKYEVNKKISPYLSAECYFIVDDVKEQENYISRYRYEAGISYQFNRAHSINPFILYQHNIPSDFNELIYGLAYAFSL
jgi:hypothetical protein